MKPSVLPFRTADVTRLTGSIQMFLQTRKPTLPPFLHNITAFDLSTACWLMQAGDADIAKMWHCKFTVILTNTIHDFEPKGNCFGNRSSKCSAAYYHSSTIRRFRTLQKVLFHQFAMHS